MQIQFTRDPTRADLDYLVEASNDLIAWAVIASSDFGANTAGLGAASSVSESSGAFRSVLVEDAQNPAALPARFLRLRVARH